MPSNVAAREGGISSIQRPRLAAEASNLRLVSVSPIDGTTVGTFQVADRNAVFEAHYELSVAASGLRNAPLISHLEWLPRLRRMLGEKGPELTRLVARETGKPRVEVQAAEILGTLNALSWLERNAGRVLKPRTLRRFPSRRTLEFRPYGVMGLISAWNYPIFLTLPVIAAALAAGNTVLWKPSELAPATSAALFQLLDDCGLGDRVRLVQGDAETGMSVVAAACDKYVFIGGGQGGRAVLGRLGELARPAVAELSGCDPSLVLADADLDLAARALVWGRTMAAGQTCLAPRRIFVEQSVYEPFLERLKRNVERLRVGDPREETTEVGPLRTQALLQKAVGDIAEAVSLGARLLCGGQTLPGPGNYLTPALLAECDETMAVFRDDLFAPVIAVSPVANAAEAVRRAGATGFALSASVWTSNRTTGEEVARLLPGSVVSINDLFLAAADGGVPFGGAGASGYGRVRGEAGLLEMVQTRVIDHAAPKRLPRFHLRRNEAGSSRLLEAVGALLGGPSTPGRLLEVARAGRSIRKVEQ